MSTKKVYFMMLGLVVLLALAAVASLVYGNIYLEKQASKLNELKIEDKVLEEQQTALTQAKKDLEKYAELEKIAKSIVPQDKDQAKAVLEIIEIAKQSDIKIKSISFASSNLGAKPTTPSSGGSGGENKPAQPQTAPISQSKPVDGIPGVYSLEMNIVPEGDDGGAVSYYQFLDFLSRLENNRRTAQVTQIKVTPQNTSADNPTVMFTLTINIFVKP